MHRKLIPSLCFGPEFETVYNTVLDADPLASFGDRIPDPGSKKSTIFI